MSPELQGYAASLRAPRAYVLPPDEVVNCGPETEEIFAQTHERALTRLLEGTPTADAYAYAGEIAVYTALNSIPIPLAVELAPQYLEQGLQQSRGLDVILASPSREVMLGVNAKLRRNTKPERHPHTHGLDGYTFHAPTKSPRISCSLGNFGWVSQDTIYPIRTCLEDSLRDTSGPVDCIERLMNSPYFEPLRLYILGSLLYTTHWYQEHLGNHLNDPPQQTTKAIPPQTHDRTVLYDKLCYSTLCLADALRGTDIKALTMAWVTHGFPIDLKNLIN